MCIEMEKYIHCMIHLKNEFCVTKKNLYLKIMIDIYFLFTYTLIKYLGKPLFKNMK